MRFDVITLFPEAFESPLRVSLLGRAISSGSVEVVVHDLRDWAKAPHSQVDDEPFGGGAGMVMMPGPIVAAVEEVRGAGARTVIMSAAGKPLDQKLVLELSESPQVVLVCGRYEGIDARVTEILGADEISIGEFVLAGGETAALAVIESVARLTSGFVGNEESLSEESFSSGLLEYPQYTRPQEFRGLQVPNVLVSGDHGKVAAWRREQALRRTFEFRPHLLERLQLDREEEALLATWRTDAGID